MGGYSVALASLDRCLSAREGTGGGDGAMVGAVGAKGIAIASGIGVPAVVVVAAIAAAAGATRDCRARIAETAAAGTVADRLTMQLAGHTMDYSRRGTSCPSNSVDVVDIDPRRSGPKFDEGNVAATWAGRWDGRWISP
jgi:hypothetical protein